MRKGSAAVCGEFGAGLKVFAIDAVDNIAGKLNIVILKGVSAIKPKCVAGGIHTANSPISASSIPITSSSSLARRLSPGIRFMTKRMMQLPPKDYVNPETESANWYAS